MSAIGLSTCHGGVELIDDLVVPVPSLGARDILVRVLACGLNPVDTKKRSGFGKPGPVTAPVIMGYDGVGMVEALGSDASLFKVGDKVYTAGVLNRNGTNADFMAVDERIVALAPKSLSAAHAASVPLVLLTAWEGLFESLGLTAFDFSLSGKSILVLPGAGGVGSYVIQLAKKLLGLTVIATASRAESMAACIALGADFTINHREPLQPQIAALGLTGVDFIYNAHEVAVYFPQFAGLINPFGKIVNIVASADKVDISSVMAKRVTFVWELMFTRPLFGVDPIQQHHILAAGARLIDCGLLSIPAVEVLPYSAASLRAAHTKQETGTVVGKLVLSKE